MLYLVGASVKKGFQATVYVASTMQTAGIEEIRGKVSDPGPPLAMCSWCVVYTLQECLEVGEKGCVRFRFQCHPEFLRLSARVLFREGRTKGIGEITHLCPTECPVSQERTSTSMHCRPDR